MTQLEQNPGPTLDAKPPEVRTRPTFGLLKNPMLIVLAVQLIITSFIYPSFWSLVNLQNLLTQNSPLAVAAVGMTLVMIAGGFDLSVGAIFGAGAVFYVSMDGTMPVVFAVLAAVAIGMAFGTVNGLVVNALGVNPFVATLGSASVITGLVSLYYSRAEVKYTSHESFRWLGSAKLGELPVSSAVAAVVVVIAGLILAKSIYGRSIYAIGGNVQAARLSGLRVGLVSASTFILIGGLAALGGILQASQVGTAEPSFGSSLTLDAIAVVIIGGTSLLGGEGAVWRTVVGIAILAIINNVFSALTLDPNLQLVIKGSIVIIAVAVDVWFYRRKSA